MTTDQLEARLADLEARLAALEGASGKPAAAPQLGTRKLSLRERADFTSLTTRNLRNAGIRDKAKIATAIAEGLRQLERPTRARRAS
jgi:hypothetical protein